jgi:cellulose synthase/poly-beta-1,6-N-acetylglucosamine synthase-like glycosyltransferase
MKTKSNTIIKILVYAVCYAILGFILLMSVFSESTDSDKFGLLRTVIIVFASILLTKYFIYMFLSPWNEIRLRHRQACFLSSEYKPKVSIIVPAWNEEVGIITTIQGLLKSNYKNVEILVVDNASTDNTAKNVIKLIETHEKKLQKNSEKLDIKVKYLLERTQGKGHALNTGLIVATGDIIMSIDADCYVPPDTVGNFVRYFADPTVMAAVGNVRIGNTDTVLGVVQYLEFLFSFLLITLTFFVYRPTQNRTTSDS